MDDYIRAAIAHSPLVHDVQRQQQSIILQREILRAQQRSLLVSLSADYLFAPFFGSNGRVISLTTSPSSDAYGYEAALSNGGLYSALINVSVPLLDGGVLSAGERQSSLLTQQNRLIAQANERMIAKTVTDLYLAAYQWQRQIDISNQILELVKARKDVVAEFVSKGLMQQSDYLLLEIEESNRRSDVLQVQSSLRDAQTQLLNACLLQDTSQFKLAEPMLTMTEEVQQFNLVDRFRIDSLILESQELSAKTHYNPQISAFGNAGINAIDPTLIPHNVGVSAGIHAGLVLFDGGQLARQHELVQVQTLSLQDNRDAAILQLRQSLHALRDQIALTQRNAELLTKQQEHQTLLLSTIQDKVVLGQVSVTDYLLAIQDYAATQLKIVQCQVSIRSMINQYNYLNR